MWKCCFHCRVILARISESFLPVFLFIFIVIAFSLPANTLIVTQLGSAAVSPPLQFIFPLLFYNGAKGEPNMNPKVMAISLLFLLVVHTGVHKKKLCKAEKVPKARNTAKLS